MKPKIRICIAEALDRAHEAGALASSEWPPIEIETPRIETHGDLSTNIAMVMAKIQKMAPKKIAQIIIDHIEDPESIIDRTEIAGPGFLNFFIHPKAWLPRLKEIHEAGDRYGASDMGKGIKYQVEYVSSNPTGPLHVGHGRGAAVGDSVANILGFCGYDVQKEYYINDSGRQIRTLGLSVFIRYKELLGQNPPFPDECYQGDYIKEIAGEIRQKHGESMLSEPEDEAVLACARYAAEQILKGIETDLADFGVRFDRWFSEQRLYDEGKVEKTLAAMKDRGLVYEKEGALWFKTTDYGDEKDRVVVRGNGQTTYFASDIAYHIDKYERGFDRVIDVWGADHHGYIPRMRAAIEASGQKSDEQFHVILVQLVNLLRAGTPVAMSTRAGQFVTLKEVVDEVGRDAARFLFLTRHYESPLDFDLELARQQTNDNPVYYVQYVHARISSIIEKGVERGLISTIEWQEDAVRLLVEPEEIGLIKLMSRYPETVEMSAKNLEPHRITYFLMSLATAFHAYYNKHRVLMDESPLLIAGRLYLVAAVRKVIRNGLSLLGVSAPEKM